MIASITWDLGPLTSDLTDLGTALISAGVLGIAAGFALYGLQRGVRFILGLFKDTAGERQDPDAWRAKVPPMSGSWKGSQEGWENDWRGRHPKAFHGKW